MTYSQKTVSSPVTIGKSFIQKEGSVLHYQKGETIFKQHTFVTHVALLQKGLAKLFMEGDHGDTQVAKFLKPGDFIGLTGLFEESAYHFSVVSLCHTEVAIVHRDIFRAKLASSQALSEEVMAWYCSDSAYLYHKLHIMGTRQLPGRLADILLYLNQPGFRENHIYHHITRKDMAKLAGMSTESMIRLLSDFKAQGLVSIHDKEIELLNEEALIGIRDELKAPGGQ